MKSYPGPIDMKYKLFVKLFKFEVSKHLCPAVNDSVESKFNLSGRDSADLKNKCTFPDRSYGLFLTYFTSTVFPSAQKI